MCGRFTLALTPEVAEWFEIFGIDLSGLNIVPQYNIAPTNQVMTIVSDGVKDSPELMRWGSVPFWIKNMNDSSKMINARAETVSERPSYKNAFRSRRCLIPATSFFEWKKGPGKTRLPMRIMLKSEEPFAFAGIWERATPKNFPDQGEITSCSIITTDANELVRPIHDRMPVIVPPDLYRDWMNPANQDIGELKEYLLPYEPGLMKTYPVSPLVNSARNQGPELIEETVE